MSDKVRKYEYIFFYSDKKKGQHLCNNKPIFVNKLCYFLEASTFKGHEL